jgi:hypothetical protein
VEATPFCARWLGLAPVFFNRDNLLPWMSEAIDLNKEEKPLRDERD